MGSNGKKIWKSKTLWFNVLAAVVLVASEVGFGGFEADPQLMALVAAAANVVLRFVTREPVEL